MNLNILLIVKKTYGDVNNNTYYELKIKNT